MLAWGWHGIVFFSGPSHGLRGLCCWFVALSLLRRSYGGFLYEPPNVVMPTWGIGSAWTCDTWAWLVKQLCVIPVTKWGCLWGRHCAYPLPRGCLRLNKGIGGLSSCRLVLKLLDSQSGESVMWSLLLSESFHQSCPSTGEPKWLWTWGPEGAQGPLWLGQWSCWMSSEGKVLHVRLVFVYLWGSRNRLKQARNSSTLSQERS